MKTHPVGAELAHAEKTDRQTEMAKIVVAFHNLAKAPDNEYLYQKKKTL